MFGFAGSAWKWVIKPSISFLNGLWDQWNRMVAELTPNGGSSIKDAVGRIETRQIIFDQKMKALNNDARFGVWESDSTGKVTYANRTYQRITGRSLEDLENWGWVNTISMSDRERVLDDWALSIKQEREFASKFNVIKPDGTNVDVISVGHPLKCRNGTLKGYIGQLVTADAHDDVLFSLGN